jgi:hypothetical protein
MSAPVAQQARREDAEVGDTTPGRRPSGMPPAAVALAVEAATEPVHLLTDLVALNDTAGWTVRTDEAWAHADFAPADLPIQGWKLHVSATEASVLDVLAACAAVLLPAGTPFKVAATYAQVRTLTSPHCPRGNAGKVVTVYPSDLDGAIRLAHELDMATDGLAGPRILNDRALRDGSLVHYRYGVFTGTPVLTHDGELQLALVTPDGHTVSDTRGATFTPPAWLTDPFQSSQPEQPSGRPASVTAPAAPARVLLGARFAVREAIRHANRGGVFRAEDLTTREAVIVKQARAHVAADRQGRDARDRLRHEWAVLGQLAATGLTPLPVELFEQGGDLFLAESDLGAETLRAWVSRRGAHPATSSSTTSDPSTSDTTDAVEVLRHVAAALRVVHEHGLVLRDLTPNNLLVRGDRTVAIIDPELAISADADVDLSRRSGTAAYASAEQLGGAAPEPAMDLHALGALVLFVLTGEDPLLGVDGSTSIDAWLDRGSRRHGVPADLADLAVRLTGDPAVRPSVDEVIEALEALQASARPDRRAVWTLPTEAARARHALTDIEPIDAAVADAAIETLLDRLVREISPHGSRVARASAFGETTLPTNVQHGASGLLGVLTQAARLLGDERARRAAVELAGWVDRAPAPQGGSVGLHFGHAGPAWALAETGALLDDRDLLARAVSRALTIPADFPGPDVTQGIAGLGLTLVRLWELTGDERVVARLEAVAEELAGRVTRDAHGVSWFTPTGTPSTFAGKRFHGYAHGTAGIGTFLRYAADALADDRLLALSVESADSLVRASLELSDERLLWGSSPEEPAPGIQHWCNGSSGVATFLARMSGERALGGMLDDVLDGAARAIVASKWQSGSAYCHGLSGNADTLLDLADVLGGTYRDQAADLLRIMWDRRQVDALGPGLGDEPGRITPDFGVGYAGALSTLLRLRHGGPRLWMPEGVR